MLVLVILCLLLILLLLSVVYHLSPLEGSIVLGFVRNLLVVIGVTFCPIGRVLCYRLGIVTSVALTSTTQVLSHVDHLWRLHIPCYHFLSSLGFQKICECTLLAKLCFIQLENISLGRLVWTKVVRSSLVAHALAAISGRHDSSRGLGL